MIEATQADLDAAAAALSTVKRLEPYWGWSEMNEQTDGDFVRYDDAIEAIARHRAEQTAALAERLATLQTLVQNLSAIIGKLCESLRGVIAEVEGGNLYGAMCCSGHDCGCRGSSNADLLVHNIRETLAAIEGPPA